MRVFNVVDVNAQTLDAAQCDWTLYVEQVSDSKRLLPLRLRLVFNAALYARTRIAEMLHQVQVVLDAMTAAPKRAVARCVSSVFIFLSLWTQ